MSRLKALPSRLQSLPPRLARPPETSRQETRALHTGSKAWLSLRQAVLLRDNHRCQRCVRLVVGRNAHVDHIDGDSHNNEMTNLQTLCIEGHSRKTQAEKAGQSWDGRCGDSR